jgi:hypothetical protein
MQIRHQKYVMMENRAFREQQYAKRRQQDYEEALNMEFVISERAREEYKNQTKMQLDQHFEILERKAAAKHAKNLEFANEVVSQIVDLSLKVSFCPLLYLKKTKFSNFTRFQAIAFSMIKMNYPENFCKNGKLSS